MRRDPPEGMEAFRRVCAPVVVMAESDISKTIISWLRGQGCYVIKIHGDMMQERGLPDIWACWRGRLLVIETKQKRNVPSRLQTWQLGEITKAGGLALVAYSLEDVQKWFALVTTL